MELQCVQIHVQTYDNRLRCPKTVKAPPPLRELANSWCSLFYLNRSPLHLLRGCAPSSGHALKKTLARLHFQSHYIVTETSQREWRMRSFICQQDLAPPANIRLQDQEWKTNEHLTADWACHLCGLIQISVVHIEPPWAILLLNHHNWGCLRSTCRLDDATALHIVKHLLDFFTKVECQSPRCLFYWGGRSGVYRVTH